MSSGHRLVDQRLARAWETTRESRNLDAPTPREHGHQGERAGRPPGHLVQFPTDRERSATSGYRRARAGSRALTPPIDEATLLAALTAVLFRYTQQEVIALDVDTSEGDSIAGSRTSLICPATADQPVGALRALIAPVLETLPAEWSEHGQDRSNIGITFLAPGDGPVDAVDESDTHDLHFLVDADFSRFEVAYNERLFEVATVERLADAVARVSDTLGEQPETLIGHLPILSAADLQTIRVARVRDPEDAAEMPVHRLFERLAEEHPALPAARFEGETLTYGELETRSNQLAHHLLACGVTPGRAVAVCVPPSLDVVVAFLAIWKAGGVYVPLDPTHPEAFNAIILEEVDPAVVLTQSSFHAVLQPERYPHFCFDTDWHLVAALPRGVPALAVTLDAPAYVLYTSGTTGKPKGVDARHGNLAQYVRSAREEFGFRRGDVFASLARYTFSISLFELVTPLTCGGCVRLLARDDVLAPNRLAQCLEEVTVVHAGPSLLGNLFRYLRSSGAQRRTLPNLRHASSGGDLVPPTLMEEMKQVFENAELFVIYGCTEISCMGCTYPIPRDQAVTRTFVGKPFEDVVVRVLDPLGNPVPFGAVGEICFAGKGVVQGYLQRPELTAEKFLEREGLRFYHTGDLGRLHVDGNLEILGRRDYQVQIRGIRIELPGIENKVRAIGLAEQCAVVVKKLSDMDVRLVAFVVKPRESTVAGFRRVLATHLPDYMLPQALVIVDQLPLNRNGKLDRNALQKLPWEAASAETVGEDVRNGFEAQIAHAFARTLGVAEIGLDDNFFDCGGHSLLAVQLLQELENSLGLELSLDMIFEHSTVRAFAAHAQSAAPPVPRPIPLTQACDRPPLFLLLGVQLYRPLARHLEGIYSVYGVYACRELAMLDSVETPPTVAELASDYVEIIRRQQPSGPYRVGGISFGGIVAYEVAQQLRALGEEVIFVGLIDAVLPECGPRHRLRQLGRLLSLPMSQFLGTVAKCVTKRLRRLRGEAPTSEFVRYHAGGKLDPMDEARQAAYAQAARHYVSAIQPFRGNVQLIVAGRRLASNPLQSPNCGWGKHVPSLQVCVFDSEHLGLVEEPAAAHVAETIRKCLTSAQSAGDAERPKSQRGDRR